MNRIILALGLVAMATAGLMAQTEQITAKRLRATQRIDLRTRYVDSLITVINSMNTDHMSPTAKAVYDYVQDNLGTGGGHVIAGGGTPVAAKDTLNIVSAANVAAAVSNTSTRTNVTLSLPQNGATSGQVQTWDGAAWTPQDASVYVTGAMTGSGSNALPLNVVTGGITNTYLGASAVTSDKIRDTTIVTADLKDTCVTMSKIAQANATSGQVLKWNGSAWAPAADSDGGASPGNLTAASSKVTVTGGTGAVIGSGTTVDVNQANLALSSIGGSLNASQIAQGGATSGQVLKWNGSAWVASTDSINTGTLTGSGTATQVATWSGASTLTGSNTMAYETNTLSLYPSADDTIFKAQKNGAYFGLQTLVDPHNGSQNAFNFGGLKGDTRWWLKGYEAYVDVPLRQEQSTGIEFRGSSGSLYFHPDGDHYTGTMGGDNGTATRNFHWYYSSGGNNQGNPMVFHQVFGGNDTLFNSFDFFAECTAESGITYPDSNLFRVGNKDRGTAMNILQSGLVGIKTQHPVYSLDISATDGIRVPIGTTAQRPSSTPQGVVRFNTDSTALEVGTGAGWTKLGSAGGGGGGGDIVNGGNTTGSTVTIGTNDAKDLALETNNVTRATITGGASTGGAWTTTDVSSNTNTVESAHTTVVNSSGTAATGFGMRHVYQLESTTTNAQNAAALDVVWSDATHATRTGDIVFSTVASAAALAEAFRIGGTTYQLTATAAVSNTNSAVDRLVIRTNSTGTPAANFGQTVSFYGETSTTDNTYQAGFGPSWTTATHASRTSGFGIYGVNSGTNQTLAWFQAASAPYLVINNGITGTQYANAGITTSTGFTLGNSASQVTIGNSSGTVNLVTSAASGGAVTITTSGNAGGVIFGNTAFSSTSLSKKIIDVTNSYTVASGSGTMTMLALESTYNLTSTASGTQIGLDVNPTLTNLASGTFRGINIPYSNSSAYGVYQSGTSTTNIFAGPTAFGTTSTPDSKAVVEFSSTTKGVLLPRMTTTQRDAISSPPAGLLIFNTTTTKMECYDGSTWQAAW